MTKFKRFIFWTTFPVMAIVVIITTLFLGLFELLEKGCHEWEGWCMEYEKNGYTRVEGGFWSKWSHDDE